MDPNKFTTSTQETLSQALETAKRYNNPSLEDIHVFYALLTQDGPARTIINQLSDETSDIAEELEKILETLPTSDSSSPPQISTSVAKLLDSAQVHSQSLQDQFIAQESLLFGLLDTSEVSKKILSQKKIAKDKII